MAKYINVEDLTKSLREMRTKHAIQAVFGPDQIENAIQAGTLEGIAQAIELLPAADVQEVKHGRWELIDKGHGFYDWECSACGGSGRGDYVYCPNCGAKMDEVGDNAN